MGDIKYCFIMKNSDDNGMTNNISVISPKNFLSHKFTDPNHETIQLIVKTTDKLLLEHLKYTQVINTFIRIIDDINIFFKNIEGVDVNDGNLKTFYKDEIAYKTINELLLENFLRVWTDDEILVPRLLSQLRLYYEFLQENDGDTSNEKDYAKYCKKSSLQQNSAYVEISKIICNE